MHLDALSYVQSVVERMEALPRKEYFVRNDRATEFLVHEEWPLACLAKALYHPHRKIKVLYRGDQAHGVPDAEFLVEGSQKEIEGWNDITPVEITTVHYKAAHIVRKELGLYGWSIGEASDNDQQLQEFATSAAEVLRKKYRNSYPSGTIILCAIFPDVSFGLHSWYQFVQLVTGELVDEVNNKTYLLDTFTNHYQILYPRRD